MNTSALVPVHILTGFLGSGKTTLLNRALQSGLGADTAVVVNEFGSVGLDQLVRSESLARDGRAQERLRVLHDPDRPRLDAAADSGHAPSERARRCGAS